MLSSTITNVYSKYGSVFYLNDQYDVTLQNLTVSNLIALYSGNVIYTSTSSSESSTITI